jgi:TatD DNase family protein
LDKARIPLDRIERLARVVDERQAGGLVSFMGLWGPERDPQESVETRPMAAVPSLDAHAHFAPTRTAGELRDAGAVLAMMLSLEEVALHSKPTDLPIAWGVGCHPRNPKAQEAFDAERFAELVERTAVGGEIGLDTRWSRVPLATQLETFRRILAVLAKLPRLVSIHSYSATSLVLEELRRRPIAVPILHWWTGTVAQTREAVALGCYFSVHSAVVRQSKFRTAVPPERLLVESDHGWSDPPAAIPCRVEWVEHLLAQHLGCRQTDVRELVWRNLSTIVRETGTRSLLPEALQTLLPDG